MIFFMISPFKKNSVSGDINVSAIGGGFFFGMSDISFRYLKIHVKNFLNIIKILLFCIIVSPLISIYKKNQLEKYKTINIFWMLIGSNFTKMQKP